MKKMTYKTVMAAICFGMMASDAIAQERGGRERGEGAQRRERPSGEAGEQRRQRGQGAELRERPSGAAGEQRRQRGQGAERSRRPSGAAGRNAQRGQGAERSRRPSGAGGERSSRGSQFGGRGGQGGPGGFMRMFPVMVALDRDGNGEISSLEIGDAVAALKKLDKNKDGKLTEDELRPSSGERGGASGQRPSRGSQGRGAQRPGRPTIGE